MPVIAPATTPLVLVANPQLGVTDLKAAMEATKSTDGKKVAGYMLEGKPFKTVIGDISYDKKGDYERAIADFTRVL